MTPTLPHADHPRVLAANAAFDAALAACDCAADPAVPLARSWSAIAHAAQVRPDGSGTPYCAHPLSVATRVAGWWPAAPASVIAAALLHDTLEDQPAALVALAAQRGVQVDSAEAALAAVYGPAVLQLVQALTNPPWTGAPEGKNAAYRDHVVHTVVDDGLAGVVKLADFYDNALALHAVADPIKRAKLSAKYRPVVAALADALGALGPAHGLAAGRDARVTELRAALADWQG
jgi:(p)ppGpp synthase/HD superfamily hydrolase